MMHYGFCRKHADQTGEGGCPECAMDHQQEEIIALRAEVEALTRKLNTANANHERFEREWYLRGDEIEALQARIAELEEVSKSTLAALCAAVSLLEHGGKKAAPSDKMFDQMMKDYNKTIVTARKALRGEVAE